jgi:hypothetical protein
VNVTRDIGLASREIRDAKMYGWPVANLIVCKADGATVYTFLFSPIRLFSVAFAFTVRF